MLRWQRPYYGWVVVAASLTVMTLTSGLGFYNLSVYLRAFALERHYSIAAVSGPTGAFFLAAGLSGLVVAKFFDRYGVRSVMMAATVVAASALAAIGWAATVTQLYVVYVVFGFGLGGISVIPATTVLTRWFVRKRATAIAIASSGLSLGGVVLTPLTARLVTDLGLRQTTAFLAVTMLVVLLPTIAIGIRDSPGQMGLNIDGERGPFQRLPAITPENLDLRRLIHNRFFVAITSGYIFVQLAGVGAIAHQFNLVSSQAGERTGAAAVSVLAGSSLAGRLIGGAVLAAAALRPFLFVQLGVQGTGLVLLAFARTPVQLIVASCVFGLSLGNLLMLESLLTAEAFGTAKYAKVFAIQQLVVRLGVTSGPIVFGVMHTLSGSYTAPFAMAGLMTFATLVLFLAAGPVRPQQI